MVKLVAQGRKRKIDSECRVFKEQWNIDYFVTESNNKALCVICNDTIAVRKEYNIRRHYDTKHSSQYCQFTGQLRNETFDKLKNNLSSLQIIFKTKAIENEATTRASFHVAHLLVKKGKPFTDGELIIQCLHEVAKEMCPEKVELCSTISLSVNTVACRVENIERNSKSQLKDKAGKFVCFSVALDESVDVSDTSQLLLFIRGINANFEITEELASLHSMHGTTTGIYIFREVEKSVAEYNLEWEKLKCITTDIGRNMCGIKKGLVGQINNAVENSAGLKPLVIHCILHQQALCGKYLDLSSVLDPVISIGNYIRSHGLKHSQCRDCLEEMNAEFPDLLTILH